MGLNSWLDVFKLGPSWPGFSLGGAWCERSELYLGFWGLAPSENLKLLLITTDFIA